MASLCATKKWDLYIQFNICHGFTVFAESIANVNEINCKEEQSGKHLIAWLKSASENVLKSSIDSRVNKREKM